MKTAIYSILFVFLVSCSLKPSTQKQPDDNEMEEMQRVADSIKNASSLYVDAKLRLSVINDIYKANAKSITVNGASVKSISDIKQVLDQFEKASFIINTSGPTEPDSTKKVLSDLKKILIKAQVKEFPLLRQKFIKFTANDLWENNITVNGTGSNIYFIGGAFANNRNIKDVQEKIIESLEKLRFKRSYYQWYKGSESTYYNISSKKDTDF